MLVRERPRLASRTWLMGVAAAAVGLVLLATRSGVGVSTDSVSYLAEAHELRAGHGLSLPAGLLEIYDDVDTTRDRAPTAHFPPLYPSLLALSGGGPGGAGGTAGARWLNALLLATSAVVVAGMVEAYTRARALAWGAAATVVLAPAVLRVHSMVWSESLLTAVGLSALFALATFLEDGRTRTLVVASLGLGAAWLTRYVGVAFVLTGLVVLARHRERVGPGRFAAVLAVAAAPMAAYLAAVKASGGRASGYHIALHGPRLGDLGAGVDAARGWFGPRQLWSPVGCAALAAVAVLVYVHLRPGPGQDRPLAGDRHRALPHLPTVLGLFLALYGATLLVSVLSFAEPIPLEERFFVPAYVAAVPLLACRLASGVRRPMLAAAVAIVAATTVVAGLGQLRTGSRPEDLGFARPAWRDSEALQEIAGLPESVRIYSNFPEAISFWTPRQAHLVPRRPPRRASPGMTRLAEEVRSGQAVVVVFTRLRRDGLPGPDELSRLMGVPGRAYLADALVYGRGTG